ncbi:component of SufBCD complex [Paracoccus sp. p4-l81]|uniref:component of SufBCD complex n=1 Tax=unclassified Paracoccus (in: a-proteobacteria) TaxID=2688777 RepID=UPI0035B91C75
MTAFHILSDLIDTRSFASLWFWLCLSGIWVLIGQSVLGVPLPVVLTARRGGAPGRLTDWLRLSLPRIAGQGDNLPAWAGGAFVLTLAAVAGFGYGAESGQVAFLLLAPLALVAVLRRGLARRLMAEALTDETQIARRLIRHRWRVQLIGALSLIATAFWGMGQLVLRAYG